MAQTQYVQAAYDFTPESEAELTFSTGDIVEVLSRDGDWWEGRMPDGRVGLFPASYVVPYYAPPAVSALPATAYADPTQKLAVASPQSSSSSRQGGGRAAGGEYKTQDEASTRKLVEPVLDIDSSAKMRKPASKTRYGAWASNMAIYAGWCAVGLGIADIIWGLVDLDNKNHGLIAVVCGVYSCCFGVGTVAYETFWGTSRMGDKFPWRALGYFILHGFMYAQAPTAFGGALYMCVVAANFYAAMLGEEYAPEPVKELPKVERPADSLTCGQKIVEWFNLQRRQSETGTLFFVGLYLAGNIAIFAYMVATWEKINSDLKPTERLSDWAPWAKGFGGTLDLNCAIIVIPVLRTMIRWLYNMSTKDQGCFAVSLRKVLDFVPLDKALSFHMLISQGILWGSVGHTGIHAINYIKSPSNTWDRFGVWPWVSGGMLLVVMILMYGAAQPNVKAKQFEIFWYSHHLFIAFFVITLLHGGPGYNPNYWKWFALPGALYVLERLMRYYRARKPAVLLSVTNMRPNVFSLEFAKEGVFKHGYSEGQYVFIKCPALSSIQWHPFTISSAPQEKTVTVHIRKMDEGSWTGDLATYMSSMGAAGATYFELTRQTDAGLVPGKIVGPDGRPIFELDGPHSAPTQHVGEYHTVMVVGSGIGVTPLSSTVKSVVHHRWKYSLGRSFPDNAYFYWVCPHGEIDSYRWLIRIIKDVEDELYDMRQKNPKDMNQKRFEFHIFVSSVPKDQRPVDVVVDDEIGFWGVPSEDRKIQKVRAPFTEEDIYKIMKCPEKHVVMGDLHIYNGRPNWDERFGAVSSAHPKGTVGVMFCGNHQIAQDLKNMCGAYSSLRDERIFKLHKVFLDGIWIMAGTD